MSPSVLFLLAALAMAVLAARALWIRLAAAARSAARTARVFAWGGALGACLGAAHSHLPAALALAAVAGIAALAAVRVLARPGIAWGMA
jgi:hypothetical protein